MKAKKYFGQNFLVDKNITKKISDAIASTEKDLIIEIGPGMGALTEYIQQKKSFILCYEIDSDMKPYLSKFEDDKTKIIYQDFLKSDVKKDIENISYDNLYIVGNLPYYITTPIIKYIISLDLDIHKAVFMVQDEVANRYTAKENTKEYGSITLFLKYYFDIEKLFKVSKNCFQPIPKVESAVLSLTNRINKIDVDKEKYFKLIADSFKMKRKTLKNNLSEYNFTLIKEILNKHNFDETARAENLREEVFLEIAKLL